MRYLSLAEVLLLHRLVMEQSGQQAVLRDLGALQPAIAQPRQTFGGQDLYRDVAGKAAPLGFSLIQNHPFVDGNKRVGHAAIVTFLRLNGRRLEATVDGSSTDPAFVRPGAVAWLLLDVVGTQEGPSGGDTLTLTTQIQRLNTSGGVAPSTGCSVSTDVGNKAFVPYTADYFFYRIPDGDDDDGN